MEPSDSVLVVVIGSQGQLRSKSLEHSVTKTTNVAFIDPVQIEKEDRLETVVNERLSEIICGKKLSDSELGCAIAHKKARKLADSVALSSGAFRWALIVEDDADLDFELLNIIKGELRSVDFKSPAVVNYDARNTRGSLRFRGVKLGETFRGTRFLADGAVCYAMNREGLEVFRRFDDVPIDCVADWPVQFSHLRIYIPNQTRVFEIQGPTSIRHRHQPKHWLKMHLGQLLNFKKIATLYGLSIRQTATSLFIVGPARANYRRLQVVQSKIDASRKTAWASLRNFYGR